MLKRRQQMQQNSVLLAESVIIDQSHDSTLLALIPWTS